jgi:hypothetical protein
MRCTISQLYLVKNSTCFGQIYCPSIGVFNTVFTATSICHTGYVDCLLARSGWNSSIVTSLAVNITSMTNTNCCEYNIKTPDDGQ